MNNCTVTFIQGRVRGRNHYGHLWPRGKHKQNIDRHGQPSPLAAWPSGSDSGQCWLPDSSQSLAVLHAPDRLVRRTMPQYRQGVLEAHHELPMSQVVLCNTCCACCCCCKSICCWAWQTCIVPGHLCLHRFMSRLAGACCSWLCCSRS